MEDAGLEATKARELEGVEMHMYSYAFYIRPGNNDGSLIKSIALTNGHVPRLSATNRLAKLRI
jgi:hypothetical protein